MFHVEHPALTFLKWYNMQKTVTETAGNVPDHVLKEATHRHYKGGYYKVLGTAKHTETDEQMVVYEHVYPHEKALFVRPAVMFHETLEDGTKRFASLSESIPAKPAPAISPVTDASFQKDVIEAEGIVVVKFGAEWCGPCKMLAPSLEKVAVQYAGKVTVKDMDVDGNQATPTKYGVRGIPQMSVFVGGKNVLNSTGAKSLSQLQAIFEKLIADHGAK